MDRKRRDEERKRRDEENAPEPYTEEVRSLTLNHSAFADGPALRCYARRSFFAHGALRVRPCDLSHSVPSPFVLFDLLSDLAPLLPSCPPQVDICDQLCAYLSKWTEEAPEASTSAPAAAAPAANCRARPEGVVLKGKKDDKDDELERMAGGLGGKGKKAGKKQEAAGPAKPQANARLTHAIDALASFNKIGLLPPTTVVRLCTRQARCSSPPDDMSGSQRTAIWSHHLPSDAHSSRDATSSHLAFSSLLFSGVRSSAGGGGEGQGDCRCEEGSLPRAQGVSTREEGTHDRRHNPTTPLRACCRSLCDPPACRSRTDDRRCSSSALIRPRRRRLRRRQRRTATLLALRSRSSSCL